MIVRPPEYLDDVRERELEIQAAEARLHQLDYSLCPHCDYEVERDFLRCPSCLRKLKDPCANCAQAARPAVAHLPVLRGRGRAAAPRPAAPAPPTAGAASTAEVPPSTEAARRARAELLEARTRAVAQPRAPSPQQPTLTPSTGRPWTGP